MLLEILDVKGLLKSGDASLYSGDFYGHVMFPI
jgi:hypothetical protein